jgi:CRP-like cAMP-binding protein
MLAGGDDRVGSVLEFQRTVTDWFRSSRSGTVTRRISRNTSIYSSGDTDGTIYFVEAGNVKTMVFSNSGRACVLNIHVPGTVFGELCLLKLDKRQETAVTMRECVLKLSPRDRFLTMLRNTGLLEGFAEYLTERASSLERRIADLLMLNATHRLAATLLQLSRQAGTKGVLGTHISLKISHQELAEMIGTTRPRVSEFLQKFRALDLVRISPEGALAVDEQALGAYLEDAS